MAWSSPRRSSTSSCIYWWFQQPSLVNWSELNNTYLVFAAKDHATFHSAAWKQDYNPDLCFVPVNEANNRPLPASRKVIFNFPRSQHRPVIVEIGLSIPIVTSYPRPRWNFMKADWKKYSENLDKVLGWIPPLSENYDRLCKAIIQNQNQVWNLCGHVIQMGKDWFTRMWLWSWKTNHPSHSWTLSPEIILWQYARLLDCRRLCN